MTHDPLQPTAGPPLGAAPLFACCVDAGIMVEPPADAPPSLEAAVMLVEYLLCRPGFRVKSSVSAHHFPSAPRKGVAGQTQEEE